MAESYLKLAKVYSLLGSKYLGNKFVVYWQTKYKN